MPRIIHVAFSFFTTSAVRVLYVITFTLGSFLYLFSISSRFFGALSLLFSLFMPMPIITLSNIVSDLFTMFSCPIVKGLKLPGKRAMRSIFFYFFMMKSALLILPLQTSRREVLLQLKI